MKTPRLKASSKSKSLRSRSARREISPSLNVDKSITSISLPEGTTTTTPSVLAAQHGSNIAKKNKKRLSRAQRLRQEKGMERAEAVMDKTARKVDVSLQKGKTVKTRNAAWEDLNKESLAVLKSRNTNEQEVESPNAGQMEVKVVEGPTPTPSGPQAEFTQNEKFDFELDGEIT